MTWQYHKHYTRDEARALLPQIREWLDQLSALRHQLGQDDRRLADLLKEGHDAGGGLVNQWVKTLCQLKPLLAQFQERELQIKDLDRGLIDFPAIRDEREVFLCWEKSEPDIAFWHELDTGYAGRQPLD